MAANLFDLSGEVAVVIGATSVLGGALAEGLANAGATVIVAGRNAERGEARAKSITAKGGTAKFVSADASSRESLSKARAEKEWARLERAEFASRESPPFSRRFPKARIWG